jgi:hypothetical protein
MAMMGEDVLEGLQENIIKLDISNLQIVQIDMNLIQEIFFANF